MVSDGSADAAMTPDSSSEASAVTEQIRLGQVSFEPSKLGGARRSDSYPLRARPEIVSGGSALTVAYVASDSGPSSRKGADVRICRRTWR
jgi:hypothetical protein